MAGAHEPVSAILGRAEDHIVITEEPECVGDVLGGESRDVGANEELWAGRAGGHCAVHPHTEIAASLRQRTPRAAAVGGHDQAQPPARVAAEPAGEAGDHQPLEPNRRDIADSGGEAALAASKRRGTEKQNEVAPHP
jgi:hypothetical protein